MVCPLDHEGETALPDLVLLRHGESIWGPQDLFTGWVDVHLTPQGERQASRAGRELRRARLLPDVAHTSVLRRAVDTGTLALAGAGRSSVPVHASWRLNERCYGALQGRDRRGVRREHGEAQYREWRRALHGTPPPLEPGSAWDVSADPRYAGLPVPRTESLADVVDRLNQYWRDALVPDLRAGRTALVVAHSGTLRALVALLDELTPDELLELNVPNGMPLHYALDASTLRPVVRGGRYLEPEAARRAAAQVAAQGGEGPDGAPPRRVDR